MGANAHGIQACGSPTVTGSSASGRNYGNAVNRDTLIEIYYQADSGANPWALTMTWGRRKSCPTRANKGTFASHRERRLSGSANSAFGQLEKFGTGANISRKQPNAHKA